MNLSAIHFCNLLHDFHSFFSLAHGQKPPEEIFKLKEELFKNISPAGFWHDHWSENHKSHLREKQPVENFPISKSLHKPWLVQNLDKYILEFGQIHFKIWTNTQMK